MVELKKEEATLAGYQHHPYNALLDQYEKGATVALLDHVFAEVRIPLKNLLDQIAGRPPVEDSFLRGSFPKQKQWDFGMQLIRQLGFDFEAGRQDISEHPFTTSFNSEDVRITTRVDEHDFSHMTWSCIHETGHALYEQGLPVAYYGLPLGEYASLSIHESQSRLWENNVGRSSSWWQSSQYYPRLQSVFPAQLQHISLEQFYHGINKVQPSLIRTEADEVSYHFHVMIRYELEKTAAGRQPFRGGYPRLVERKLPHLAGRDRPGRQTRLPPGCPLEPWQFSAISRPIAWVAFMPPNCSQPLKISYLD